MRVLLADQYGMCFGVRDAIQHALNSPRPQELTILGELVHNQDVLHTLKEAGIRIAPSLDAPVETPRVMITAHGASQAAVSRLKEQGLTVEEATCPLVRHAHRMAERLVRQGYFPAVIGKRDHVEVKGLVGDLAEYLILESPEDIPLLAGRARIGVVSQTTQPLDYVLEMVDRIRAAFPNAEVKFADTVCQPTKERQTAARRLACDCNVVVVVGGRNSNNTRQLVHTCEAEGARAYQVEGPEDLRLEWFDGVDTVGLTAGTSTPDATIAAVHAALQAIDSRELACALA